MTMVRQHAMTRRPPSGPSKRTMIPDGAETPHRLAEVCVQRLQIHVLAPELFPRRGLTQHLGHLTKVALLFLRQTAVNDTEFLRLQYRRLQIVPPHPVTNELQDIRRLFVAKSA